VAEDFLDCLLVTMRWGDRWRGIRRVPPQRLIHVGHNHDARRGLLCGHCKTPLRADDSPQRGRPSKHPIRSGQNVNPLPAPDVILATAVLNSASVDGVRRPLDGSDHPRCFLATKRFDDFERTAGHRA